MENQLSCDVVIVGAGPAGSTTALMLGELGYDVIIVDKHDFPRVKICGEGLTSDVWRQFKKMPGNIYDHFLALDDKLPINGIRLGYDCSNPVQFDLCENVRIYTCERTVFDHFMLNEALQYPNVQFIKGLVEKVENKGGAIVITNTHTINAKIVVGADGAMSRVARELGLQSRKTGLMHLGVRQYFKNADLKQEGSYLEILAPKPTIPGYFWLFPMTDNRVNAGMGMSSHHIKKYDISLRDRFNQIITAEPGVADRFGRATALGPLQGQMIPMLVKPAKRSTDCAILVGDAATTANFSTGEGIGPAIRSGRFAAAQIDQSLRQNRFDAGFLAQYDKKLFDATGNENRKFYLIQRFLSHEYFVKKMMKNLKYDVELHQFLQQKLSNVEFSDKIINFKMLFRLFR